MKLIAFSPEFPILIGNTFLFPSILTVFPEFPSFPRIPFHPHGICFLFQFPTKTQTLQYFSRNSHFSNISEDSGGERKGLCLPQPHPTALSGHLPKPLFGTNLEPGKRGFWVASNGQTHQPHSSPSPEALPLWGALYPQLLGRICKESKKSGFSLCVGPEGWGEGL